MFLTKEKRFFGIDLSRIPKPTFRINFSNRPQVYRVAIISAVISGVLLIVGITFVLIRYSLSREVKRGQAALPAEYRRSEESLKEQLNAEQERVQQLADDWRRIQERLQAFQQTYHEVAGDPRRVDYKRERYNIINGLLSKARYGGVKWPKADQLGIPSDIGSEEDPARRMVQLKSAGALLGAAIDEGMSRIESARLLDPIEHTVPKGQNQGEIFAVEFPIEIVAVGDVQALGRWILAASNAKEVNGKSDYFFIVRNMKAEKAAPAEPDAVRATMIFTALLILEVPQPVEPPRQHAVLLPDDS